MNATRIHLRSEKPFLQNDEERLCALVKSLGGSILAYDSEYSEFEVSEFQVPGTHILYERIGCTEKEVHLYLTGERFDVAETADRICQTYAKMGISLRA